MDALEQLVKAAEEEWLEHWKRGPTRTRVANAPQIGDRAPDLELEDFRGKRVRLSDFWRDRPALLLFWRHYGCGCGLERSKRLAAEYTDYVAAGANVVIVGQGEPERARAYAKKYGLPPCPILCDPAFHAYIAYGLPEAVPAQILYDAPEDLQRCELEAGLRFIAARREMGRPLVDNPWQLPGEFVVDASGTIRLAYRYQYCEDFPDPRVHVTAIMDAAKT
ncbi:MAG: AhpC/TSA family protein [Euryarchaeota archaeon]|nr:AhpC/TSA family protein [Euryarchaeota archaeon]